MQRRYQGPVLSEGKSNYPALRTVAYGDRALDPGGRRWLIEPRRIGPLVRNLRRVEPHAAQPCSVRAGRPMTRRQARPSWP
jgi:hypothetical protein